MILPGGSAISELRRALEEYLSVLIGLTKKGIITHSHLSFYLKWKLICICNRI